MEINYDGFSIITAAEYDDNSGLWNGRYRILDNEGIVAYESFVEPRADQEKANEAAQNSAREWIDRESSR